MSMLQSKRSFRLIFLAFALLLAIMFDTFFWKVELGLGFVLLTLIYTTGFILITKATNHFRNPWALGLLIPVGVMALDILLYNNQLVTKGLPIFIVVLLLLFSILLTIRNPNKIKFALLRVPIIRNAFLALEKLNYVFADIMVHKKNTNSEKLKKIVIGVVLSIPILLMFGLFFISADAVFAEWMQNIFNFEISEKTVETLFRISIVWLFLSGFFYALMGTGHTMQERFTNVLKIDHTITTVVLTLVNILFLLFVFIQVKYLFGDVDFVLDSGITFAKYARSGFFELTWVIALAGLMIGFIYRSLSHHGTNKVVTGLQSLLIVLVAVIALSALKRMNVYQHTYGYTILRLYVEWFIYLALAILALGFISVIIQLEFRKYFYLTLILGLTALTVVSSINVDKMIATKNIQRFLAKETKQSENLDFNYLSKLSVDIVPALELLNKNKLEKDDLGEMDKLIKINKNRVKDKRTILEFNFGKNLAEKQLAELDTIYD